MLAKKTRNFFREPPRSATAPRIGAKTAMSTLAAAKVTLNQNWESSVLSS